MTPAAAASIQRVDELEEPVAQALLRWTLSLADTKHRLGIRTSEWVNGGPALEAAVGASAITQDELGHARSLYVTLKDFPNVPSGIGAENDLEARDDYHCPRALGESWPSWSDVIAANVLLDRALQFAVAAGRHSTFGPLKGRTAKILQEERFHRIFGDSWLAKLSRLGREHQRKLQVSLDRFWPLTLAWIGPNDNRDATLLNEAGILAATAEDLRGQWLDEVNPLLEKSGFDPLPTEVDWTHWSIIYRDTA